MITMLCMISAGAVLLILLSIPLYFKRIGPNGLYGFRVKKTMENPELWYPVNKYASIWLMLTGLAILIAGVGMYFFTPGISLDTYSLTCVAVLTVALVVTIIMTTRYMNTL